MDKRIKISIIVIILLILIIGTIIIVSCNKNYKKHNDYDASDIDNLPKEISIEYAIKEGYFVINNVDNKIYNKDILDRFIKNTEFNAKTRIADKIEIVVYNIDGYPTIYEIEYNKKGYILTTDATRNNIIPREITKNDIRAKILVIPQVIKSELAENKEKFAVVFNGIEKQLNVDKTRRYFGGVTDFYKQFGLLTDDGVFVSKKAKWKIDGDKVIVDLI